MFEQVLQGKVTNQDALRARFDQWVRDVAPGADGWLGTTAGITDDGEFVAVVRFIDAQAAERNAGRPEQDRWWSETSGLIDGEAVFHDYDHTALMMDGGSNDAGFVQVLQGTYTGDGNPGELMEDTDGLSELRPEIIGGTIAWDDGGHFSETVYFTSEAAAREGEQKMAPETEVGRRMNEWMQHIEGVRFLDVRDPWLVSP